MAKNGHTTYMTALERGLGGVFFLLYLLVLPFAREPLFRGVEVLLGRELSAQTERNVLCYILFALTLVIFWIYIGRTTSYFLTATLPTLGTAVVGLVGFYGINELSFRTLRLVIGGFSNLNDVTVSAGIGDFAGGTFLITVFLLPFVEEVLFRGYAFGNIREKNRTAAYIVSCALYALGHVWQFAAVEQSVEAFLLMVQYFVPGLVFAWCYEKSGTLWGAIIPHIFVNALAVWGIR